MEKAGWLLSAKMAEENLADHEAEVKIFLLTKEKMENMEQKPHLTEEKTKEKYGIRIVIQGNMSGGKSMVHV